MELMLNNLLHLVREDNLSKEEERTRVQERANLAGAHPRERERKPVAGARAGARAKVATKRSLSPRISGKREPKRTEQPAFFVGHHKCFLISPSLFDS
jgi:hypothetical protein